MPRRFSLRCWLFGHRDVAVLRPHPGNRYLRPGAYWFVTCQRCGDATWSFQPGEPRTWVRSAPARARGE